METKYFKNNEFDYEACKKDARNGVPEAQILFGDYLQYDETNAQSWLEQHQMMLGDYFNMYKHDTEEAKFWYKMAADAGNEYAMIKLARCYHYKENPDIEKAIELYKKSAAHNNFVAMTELISCLNDKAEIEKWIEKAEAIAKENYADRIHEFANVLRQDYFEKAMYWYSVAAQMGYEKSVYQLEIINLVSEYHKTKDESVFFEAIRKIIVMCLEKSDDEVTENSKFNQDLGADDLDMFELAYKIEEELGVSIPDEDLCDDIEEDAEYSFKFQTVKELFDLCKKYKLNN